MKQNLLSVFTACSIFTAVAGAAPQARQRAANPDQAEITAFRLNMDNINKFASASAAIVKLGHDDPALKKRMDDDAKGAKTIQASVDNIDRNCPPVAAAIHAAGLSTRDFTVMSVTIMTATMTVGMRKQGVLKEIPPSVSQENVAFVEQNYDKINAMITKLMADSNR